MNKYILTICVIIVLCLVMGCTNEENVALESYDDEKSNEIYSAPVVLDEGPSGTMDIPWVGVKVLELDAKHHWTMPANVSRVMVNVTLSGPARSMELSTGTGECPHSGMMLNDTIGGEDTLSVTYQAPENETLVEGQWFAHISLQDPSSHRGDSFTYVFSVTLFSPIELDCEDDVCPT